MSMAITSKVQMPSIPVAARAPATPSTVTGEGHSISTDKVTLGNVGNTAVTYDPRGKMPTTAADLNVILADSESKTKQIMDLLLPLLEQQGLNLGNVLGGKHRLVVDQATIDKAKAAIGDDGEFGVKQVADRILNFVKGAIGDDPSKLGAMRAAVEDGFKQAADMLGGTLPEISEKTHSVIMATFDRWASEGIEP